MTLPDRNAELDSRRLGQKARCFVASVIETIESCFGSMSFVLLHLS